MLVYEDFQETGQIQATVFTPGFIFSSSEILKKLMELEPDLFDGDPFVLPLPDDTPHEIPRITLLNARAEIALNILSFLISLSYATIIKTRCPPALRGVGSTLSPSCRLYEPEAGL